MALTDRAIKAAKPGPKPRRLSDGGGLYLEVSPAGGKHWRQKYRFGGKEKRLALGSYPDVSLAEARARRDDARRQLAQGVDPSTAKRAARLAAGGDGSFEAVAREWWAAQAPTWAESHSKRVLRLLERDLFPWLGAEPVGSIAAPVLLTALRRIESRGAGDTAHRARVVCGQLFRYAIATGRAERDPAADLRGALAPVVKGHFASVTDPAKVGPLLAILDGYQGTFPVRCALRLAPLVFCRPGELRSMRWVEVDRKAGRWSYLATKTKTQQIVPLSTQAVAILDELHPLTGHGPFAFPSSRTTTRPMSENTVNAALKRLGIDTQNELTGHGFRAMARTILEEVLGYRPEVIELQLAHGVRDPLGRAYNRTAHLDERTRMMQAWADYLDGLKAGTNNVVPLSAARGDARRANV